MGYPKYKKGQTNCLVAVASDSNPSKRYELRLGKDDVAYCTCPSWKFHGHCCKHMIRAAAGNFGTQPQIVNGGSLAAVAAIFKAQIQAQSAGYRNAVEMRAAKKAAKAAKVAAL